MTESFPPIFCSRSARCFRRGDFSKCAPRFPGFGKYLLTELQLLPKYLGSGGGARIHGDLQKLTLRLPANCESDRVDPWHRFRPPRIAIFRFFVYARSPGAAPTKIPDKAVHPSISF